jgi:hypothetical protein
VQCEKSVDTRFETAKSVISKNTFSTDTNKKLQMIGGYVDE